MRDQSVLYKEGKIMEVSKNILAIAAAALFLTACGPKEDQAATDQAAPAADTAQTTEQAPAADQAAPAADAAQTTEQAPATTEQAAPAADATQTTEQAPADDAAQTTEKATTN